MAGRGRDRGGRPGSARHAGGGREPAEPLGHVPHGPRAARRRRAAPRDDDAHRRPDAAARRRRREPRPPRHRRRAQHEPRGLVIDRLPGSRAPLPASVEAIVRDPTGGDLGRQRIAVGYDARAGQAPRRFRATALLGVGGDPNRFVVQQTTSGASEGLATIAELFDPGSGRLAAAPRAHRGRLRARREQRPRRRDAREPAHRRRRHDVRSRRRRRSTARSTTATASSRCTPSSTGCPTAVSVAYTEDGGPAAAHLRRGRADRVDPRALRAPRRRRAARGRGRGDRRPAGPPGFALTARRRRQRSRRARRSARSRSPPRRNGEPLAVAGTQPGVRARPPRRLRVVRRAPARAAGRARRRGRARSPSTPTIARQPFSRRRRRRRRRAARERDDRRPAGARRACASTCRAARSSTTATARRSAGSRSSRAGASGALRRIAATIDGLPTGGVRFATRRRARRGSAFAAARPLGAIDLVATSGRAPPRAPAGRDVVYYRDVRGAFVAHVRVSGLRGRDVRGAARRQARTRRRVDRPRRAAGRSTSTCGRASARRRARRSSSRARLDGLPDRMRLRLEGRPRPARRLRRRRRRSARSTSRRAAAALPALARRVRLDVRDLPRRLRVDQSRARQGRSRPSRTGPSGRCRWRSHRAASRGPVAGERVGVADRRLGRGSRCGCAGCGASSCGRPRRCASTRRSPASASPSPSTSRAPACCLRARSPTCLRA